MLMASKSEELEGPKGRSKDNGRSGDITTAPEDEGNWQTLQVAAGRRRESLGRGVTWGSVEAVEGSVGCRSSLYPLATARRSASVSSIFLHFLTFQAFRRL